MKRRFALVLACIGCLAAGSARAAPTLWERAREPRRAAEYTGLVRLERALDKADEASSEPVLIPEISMGALLLLKLSHLDLDSLGDPRLCFLIGRALLDLQAAPPAEAQSAIAALLTRRPDSALVEAKRLLERGLALAPGSPLAAEGYANLALVEGQLEDHPRERAAYLRALALSWDPELRAVEYLNLAESELGSGELETAIREYRLAAANAGERQDVLALAYYGLAVALERNGDLPRALGAAEQANRIKLPPGVYAAQNALDLPSYAFNPPYELHYYKALAAMAEAQAAHERDARRDALASAIEHWEAYQVMAELSGTRWLQNARLREARARRDLAALDAKSSGAR